MNSIFIYKRIIGLSILGLYLLSSCKVLSPYINYGLNQEYIITVLCENRDNVEIFCEGKCFLNKELKKASQENDGKKQSFNFNVQVEFLNADINYRLSAPIYYFNIHSVIVHNNFWVNILSEKEGPPPKA